MADDSSLEKFVLEYVANTATALKNILKLNQAVDDSQKGAKKGKTEMQNFADGIVSQFNKVDPRMAGFIGKLGSLTKGAAAAAVTLAPLLITLKTMNTLMKEYEQQRITGFRTGLSALDVESYQRQFNAASGRMTPQGSRELLEKVSNIAYQSYVDPNPANKNMMMLRNAGTSPYDGSSIRSTDKLLDEMTKKFKSVTEDQAKAIGLSIGLTVDETKAIRNRNEATLDAKRISDEYAAKAALAAESMDKIKEAQGRLSETWRNISSSIGQYLLPAAESAAKFIDDITKGVPAKVDKAITSMKEFDIRFEESINFLIDKVKMKGGSFEDYQKRADERIENIQKHGKKLADEQSKTAETTRRNQAQFEKNVNLFASSVGTFSGAIDERQAWASWAGAAAAAGGLRGIGAGHAGVALASGGGNGSQFGGYQAGTPPTAGDTSMYDAYFEEAAAKYNLPVSRLKAIAGAESNFNPNATSPKGAHGLMQVMPINWEAGDNKTDPRTQIMRGAKVLSWAYNMANGDWDEAYRFYNGGTNRGSKENNEYPGRVNNWHNKLYGVPAEAVTTGRTNIHGESRSTMQMAMVADQIANNLGMSRQQLMNGGAMKSDIAFVLRNELFEASKRFQKAQMTMEAPALLPQQRAQAAIDLRNAQMELDNLRTYGATIVGRGQGRDTDERKLTRGMVDRTGTTVNLYISGVSNGKEIADAVIPPIKEAVRETTNNNSDGVSR